MIEIKCQVIEDIVRDMRQESLRVGKAMSIAVSTTAYDTRKVLQGALRSGSLGLQPLSVHRAARGIARRQEKPLAKLATGVRYRKVGFDVREGMLMATGRTFSAEVGFLGTGNRAMQWLTEAAIRNLQGYQIMLTNPQLRRIKARMGIFLRKDTRFAAVPSRDPVGRFYERNAAKMAREISGRFERKMAGERV